MAVSELDPSSVALERPPELDRFPLPPGVLPPVGHVVVAAMPSLLPDDPALLGVLPSL